MLPITMMAHKKAPSPTKVFDISTAVENLHCYNAEELNKLLTESHSYLTLCLKTEKGSLVWLDMERLVLGLPLHLLSLLAARRETELPFRYLLEGVRLLHSLSDLSVCHLKLEQLMLHDVKIREQVLDFIIYMLIALASTEKESRVAGSFTLVHTTLVACSLHLLPVFVASQWCDITSVILAHPQVDIFMDVAFDATRKGIDFFQTKLGDLNSKLISQEITSSTVESFAQTIGQQCEASLQVLQSLCHATAFHLHILQHQELCKRGGILCLALAVMKLHIPSSLMEFVHLCALVARIKSKTLSMLVKLWQVESVCFLEEVADDRKSMQLAEAFAIEVLGLVKIAMSENIGKIQSSTEEGTPVGPLYINAMRLAEILTDDSNFRNFVMDNIMPDFVQILAQTTTLFSSEWCGNSDTVNHAKTGLDPVLIYDPFSALGEAMQSFQDLIKSSSMPCGSYALIPESSLQQNLSASFFEERSVLFVKILANLHCFNPTIFPVEDMDRFLDIFAKSITTVPFGPSNISHFLTAVHTAMRICENLFMLLNYTSSLPCEAISDEDLKLSSNFYYALHDNICPSGDSNKLAQELPVVAYIKEEHDSKRAAMIACHQSERWKRILQLCNTYQKERSQCNRKRVIVLEADSNEIEQPAQLISEMMMNYPPNEVEEEEELEWISDEIEPPKQQPTNPANVVASPIEEIGKEDSKKKFLVKEETKDDISSIGYYEREHSTEVQQAHYDDGKLIIEKELSMNEIIIPLNVSENHPNESHPDFMREKNNDTVAEKDEPVNEILSDRALNVSEDQPNESHPDLMREKNDDMQAESSSSDCIFIGTGDQTQIRRRMLMNENQILVMENALKTDPGMHKYPKLIQEWSSQISHIGPQISSKQLKNWLSNRKTKLARLARESQTVNNELVLPSQGVVETNIPSVSYGNDQSTRLNNRKEKAARLTRESQRVNNELVLPSSEGVVEMNIPSVSYGSDQSRRLNNKKGKHTEVAQESQTDNNKLVLPSSEGVVKTNIPSVSYGRNQSTRLNNKTGKLAQLTRESQTDTNELVLPSSEGIVKMNIPSVSYGSDQPRRLNNRKGKHARVAQESQAVNSELVHLSSEGIVEMNIPSVSYSSVQPTRLNNRKGKHALAARELQIVNNESVHNSSKGVVEMKNIPSASYSSNLQPTRLASDDSNAEAPSALKIVEKGDFREYHLLVDLQATEESGPSLRKSVMKCEVGPRVCLWKEVGNEVALGVVNQVEGDWDGVRLAGLHGLCLVKVTELKADKSTRLPHPSRCGGATFAGAERRHGGMLVAWETNGVFLVGSPDVG